MTNRHYKRGADAERRVRDRLETEGWYVVRSAGSHTVTDLVAFKKNHRPLFVQVKYGKAGMSGRERMRLVDAAEDCDATPVVVTRGLRFEFLADKP